ncbi:MAG: LysR substrate-binding domain-containing protein [Myxococcaceae bacterium]
MDLDQLRTFLSVLKHGSFSRAGQALRIGQSTVSFHIAALESSAGARLLDRKGGKVRLTASGITLERYARRILELRDEALENLSAQEKGERGRLTLAASTIPADYLLPPVLARFTESHPRVSVRVEVSDSGRALDRLLAQEADLAIVGATRADRRLRFTAFAEDEIVLVGRAIHPLTHKRPSEVELAKARLIVREEGSGTRQAAEAFIAQQGADGPPPLEVGSTTAAKQCVLEGAGLALLSRRAVDQELKSGAMVALSLPGFPVRRRFHLVRARAASSSALARAFAQALLQNYR